MVNFSIYKACEICGGKLYNCDNDCNINGKIAIDSREVHSGDLFVAYKGDKVDGHDYIPNAFEKGAACCLAEKYDISYNGPLIVVECVQSSVEQIAAYYRKQFSIPFIGITGSNGKTSAKEMISCVLSKKYKVLKTDKNLNNQLGVPITISSIGAEHTAAVIEMGVSKINDMDTLGNIVKPDIAVFSNIGHAHLEFLHDLAGVYHEKTKMIDYMPCSSAVIYNMDDAYLSKLSTRCNGIGYGISSPADLYAKDIRYSVFDNILSFKIIYKNDELPVKINSFGRHLVYAALEAAAVGFYLGLTNEEVASGLSDYCPVGRRSSIFKTDYLTLVDDCYNANPDSVMNSILSMSVFGGRKVCILGDMLELGENEASMHYDVGEFAKNNGIDLVLCCGKLSENIYMGASGFSVYFATVDEMIGQLPNYIKMGDSVLVKASRSMHFETVSEYLKTITVY